MTQNEQEYLLTLVRDLSQTKNRVEQNEMSKKEIIYALEYYRTAIRKIIPERS